jgi:hypothetical protein
MLRFRNSQSAARRRYQWGKQTRKTPAKKTKSTAGKSTSIFNASVPLAQTRHTGVVNPGAKGGTPHIEGGVHHYPTPITDIQLFKRDDFQLGFSTIRNNRRLWCPRGSAGRGKANVGVAYATPGTELHKKLVAAHSKGKYLHVDASHSMAKQAFAAQNAADAAKAKAAGGKG